MESSSATAISLSPAKVSEHYSKLNSREPSSFSNKHHFMTQPDSSTIFSCARGFLLRPSQHQSGNFQGPRHHSPDVDFAAQLGQSSSSASVLRLSHWSLQNFNSETISIRVDRTHST